MSDLTRKKCRPCEGGVAPMGREESERLLKHLSGWAAHGNRIRREFVFENFVRAMAFVNRIAELAETEGHHPDIRIHWNRVLLELWTHAIGGLSENDFILAAKVDALAAGWE